MELLLVRHAQAVDGGELGMRDDDRPLTAHGRRQALDVGAALQRHGVRVQAVVTSPLVRAVETATLVAHVLGFDGGLTVADSMRPEGSWKQLVREVLEPALHDPARPTVMIVGHEPSIGHALSKLLQRKGLQMVKAGVARLSLTTLDDAAQLVWALSPKSLTPSPQL